MTPNTKSNEEILKELYKQLTKLGIRWVDIDDNTIWNIENNVDACDLLAEALTLKDQAHKAEVEVKKAERFIDGILFATQWLIDNHHLKAGKELNELMIASISTTPLPESDKGN